MSPSQQQRIIHESETNRSEATHILSYRPHYNDEAWHFITEFFALTAGRFAASWREAEELFSGP